MSDDVHQKIEIPVNITVRDLAKIIEANPIQVIKILMSNGVMANINQLVDFDTAAVVASELGFEAVLEEKDNSIEVKETIEIPLWRKIIAEEDPAKLIIRAPVVTILGHVDHGKTTLLDAIRHTSVALGEAGGITQHIGAYQIDHNGRAITFLDTPGHSAFTAMRARGAQGADIVVLVVAANDGVMPQTREAIAHARAAQVPIIVALNKIDLNDANIDLVKKQLAENGLVPDEWEGDTIIVPVSAKLKTGIDDLLEAVLLVADSSSIKANPDGKVFGTVIEAELDKTKGVVASLLIQNGTLKVGDMIAAGSACGRIRAMFDYRNRKIKKAGPSTPIQVIGLNNIPQAGDLFQVYEGERDARQAAHDFHIEAQSISTQAQKVSLEELFENFQAGEVRELRLVIKVDVQGSLEPIINSLNEINKEEIKINILHSATGNITENDVMLASASKAIIIGFNVQAEVAARRLADSEGISIRLYDIIYRLIEDVEKALKGMLAPEFKETVIGHAAVLAVFNVSKFGNIAGCRVLDGEIRRNSRTRLYRDNVLLYDGEIASLRHEKEDVRDVRNGFECGIGLKNFNDFAVGDRFEFYTLERTTR